VFEVRLFVVGKRRDPIIKRGKRTNRGVAGIRPTLEFCKLGVSPQHGFFHTKKKA
jgi:hypothetical protein